MNARSIQRSRGFAAHFQLPCPIPEQNADDDAGALNEKISRCDFGLAPTSDVSLCLPHIEKESNDRAKQGPPHKPSSQPVRIPTHMHGAAIGSECLAAKDCGHAKRGGIGGPRPAHLDSTQAPRIKTTRLDAAAPAPSPCITTGDKHNLPLAMCDGAATTRRRAVTLLVQGLKKKEDGRGRKRGGRGARRTYKRVPTS